MWQKSDSENNEHQANSSSLLREKLLDLDNEDLKTLEDSGLLSEKAIRVLTDMKQALNKHDIDYRKEELYKQIIEYETSKKLNDAVENGNLSVKSFAVGRTQPDHSISQYHRLQEFKDIVTVQGRTFIVSGDRDMGKTNLSLLIAEMWQEATDGTVITNMESVKQFKTVTSFDKWQKEFRETDGRVLGIVEDANKHMSGYNIDRESIEDKYREFKINLAKNKGNMLLLAHTPMSVHPMIRRNAYGINKPSKKTLKVYERIQNGKYKNELMKLSGIPKSKIKYDSSDKTKFTFEDKNMGNEKDEKEIIRNRILEKLEKQPKVKTVDVNGRNQKVAEQMRELADLNDILEFKENKSPKMLVRPAH